MQGMSSTCMRPIAASLCHVGVAARPSIIVRSLLRSPILQSVLLLPFRREFSSKRRILKLPRLTPLSATATSAGFFSDDGVQFTDLNVSSQVEASLARQQLSRPSRVQELVMPVIGQGSSAVIAAETGSGKTLSYLAPVVSMMLRYKERTAAVAAAATNDISDRRFHALVLCPNVALCHQVLAVAQSITSDDGTPLISAAHINASNPPPKEAPDIIISTPAAIMSFIIDAGPRYGYLWTPEGLQSKLKHVILDEADLLLTRAFEKPVMQLLQLLRSGDRRRVESKVFSELNITKEDLDRLPRPMLQACWLKGSIGLKEAGYRLPGGWAVHEEASFGPYWRRQYIFVAATMPSITLSDVGSDIQRLFPDIQWLSSELLHQSKPQVHHTWIEVGDASYRTALLSSICEDPDYATGKSKMLIFAGETASADELSDLLQGQGLDHVVYHKNRSAQERSEALAIMSSESSPQGKARIMVCTDSAARGLDIQDITHVIQADFAPNAIDFIHRIGRTGRADRAGKVTSLYRKANLPLVQVLQQYIEEGRPLEAAFSRARSFSRKFKRAGGEFIPRGFTKAQYEAEDSSQVA